MVEPGGGAVEPLPVGGMVEPGGGVLVPREGVVEPGDGEVEPGGGVVEPGGGLAEPIGRVFEFAKLERAAHDSLGGREHSEPRTPGGKHLN